MPENTVDNIDRKKPSTLLETSITSSREANASHDHDSNDKVQRLMRSLPTSGSASEAKQDVTASPGSIRLSKRTSRPQLQSRPTTALSFAGAQISSSPTSRAFSRRPSVAQFARSSNESDAGDSASPASFVPALDITLDKISILGNEDSPAWQSLSAQADVAPFSLPNAESEPYGNEIIHEFENVDQGKADQQDSFQQWKTRLKHFFILSASGKPVYSRHGDDQIIGSHIGVIQTIISSYQTTLGAMRAFKAGDSRFVIVVKGPLTLVAISKLPESERQLQNQLESLYMQILSTLTLPSLEKMFSNRPSTDLRRPLQGTDVLLDGLADGFTRGSPSTLLSALECLRMRKTHRRLVNDTLLNARSPNLMYGLIAAGGRLVSVVRPKKLSLHPGDLHLIFNMLFEAGSIKAGGGENWIPLCLPGFNNRGYVYMYVSFLAAEELSEQATQSESGGDGELAVILISASKDCFFELQEMRNNLVAQLKKNGSMSIIRTAISKGQASCSEIVPGTVLRHFLYKSRGNVQYVMPSLQPDFDSVISRRRLMSLYHVLHEAVHLRTSHLKIQYGVSQDASALAWETPVFELYCVAGPRASRTLMCQGANKIIQWIRKEEERVFIIGGAVF